MAGGGEQSWRAGSALKRGGRAGTTRQQLRLSEGRVKRRLWSRPGEAAEQARGESEGCRPSSIDSPWATHACVCVRGCCCLPPCGKYAQPDSFGQEPPAMGAKLLTEFACDARPSVVFFCSIFVVFFRVELHRKRAEAAAARDKLQIKCDYRVRAEEENNSKRGV